MDYQPNFEFLCRVCAANTKGKNISVPECVYILKTPGLRDKIERHLYLLISEHDALPKVLCKTCFRQVEATASLSKISAHTQKVFRDFLFTTAKPKPPPAVPIYQRESTPRNEFTPIMLPVLPREPERSPPVTSPPPLVAVNSRKDEVVVNVSVNDPLTRETQEKMISASQKRQNSVDARYVPKSIAQRSFIGSSLKLAESGGPSKEAVPAMTAAAGSTGKKSSSGVINFIPGHPQPMTPLGGPMLGRATTNGIGGRQVSEEVLQKRRNLKMTLNNIKATHSGQVSLLKVSQQLKHRMPREQPKRPPPVEEDDDDEAVEQLPEQIIIAAAKTKRREREKVSAVPAVGEMRPAAPASRPQLKTSAGIPDDITLGNVIKDIDLLKLILNALKWPYTKQTVDAQMQRLRNSKFTDIMSDENLLQDTDLTQLLGPYLAPAMLMMQYYQQQQAQIGMAAATAGLAALSSPPAAEATITNGVEMPTAVLSNAMPYKLPPETSVQLVPASPPQGEEEPPKAPMPVKRVSSARMQAPRKLRKVTPHKVRHPASIVISDEESSMSAAPEAVSAESLATESAANFNYSLDPKTISQFNLSSGGDRATEAWQVLLQRQRSALSRQQRSQRRRQSSATILPPDMELGFDTDDIVLMEPNYDSTVSLSQQTSTTTTTSAESAIAARRYSTATAACPPITLPPPQELSPPIVTRPIIKRRKTVIQSSPAAVRVSSVPPPPPAPVEAPIEAPVDAVVATDSESKSEPPAIAVTQPAKSPVEPEPAVHTTTTTQAVPVASTVITVPVEVPTTTNGECAPPTKPVASSDTGIVAQEEPVVAAPPKTYAKRLQTSKSALGQQLLEAIGLQKVPSSTKSTAESSSSRDSVQQIRSALKRQLREAQEQKQKRAAALKRMPVIQDADSTTKGLAKEQPIVIDLEAESEKEAVGKPDYHDDDDLPLAKTLAVGSRRKTTATSRQRKPESNPVDRELRAITEVKGVSSKEVLLTLDENMIKDKSSDEQGVTSSPITTLIAGSLKVDTVSSTETTPTKSETSPSRKSSRKRPEPEEREPSVEPRSRRETRPPAKFAEERGAAAEKPKTSPRGRAVQRESGELDAASDTSSVRNERLGERAARSRSVLMAVRDGERDSDTFSLRHDDDDSSNFSPNRPTRVSKTLSKYYKGPGWGANTRRSVLQRSARVRN